MSTKEKVFAWIVAGAVILLVLVVPTFMIVNQMGHKEITASVEQEVIDRARADSLLQAQQNATDTRMAQLTDSVRSLQKEQKGHGRRIAKLEKDVKRIDKDNAALAGLNKMYLDTLLMNQGGKTIVKNKKKGNGKPLSLEEALKKVEKDIAEAF